MKRETFWYEAEILVRLADGWGDKTSKRQGTINADGPLDALDVLHEKAKESWNGTVIKAKVCTVDENGEIVATTTSSRVEPKEDKTSHSVTSRSVYDWAHGMTGTKQFPIFSLKRYMS